MDFPGFDFDSSQDVLKQVQGLPVAGESNVCTGKLNNKTSASIDLSTSGISPVVASIYGLDGIVRRAASLQLTADATLAKHAQEVAA
jgi:NADH-quinone oxidoreductase subunit G